MKKKPKIDFDTYIFSGEKSKPLWDDIWKITRKSKKHKKHFRRVFEALYSLGCKLQELETLVRTGKDARQ